MAHRFALHIQNARFQHDRDARFHGSLRKLSDGVEIPATTKGRKGDQLISVGLGECVTFDGMTPSRRASSE